ncbi:MAG: polysaccharide biosynthesis/export family protein [Verrucomicrobiota bacterium]
MNPPEDFSVSAVQKKREQSTPAPSVVSAAATVVTAPNAATKLATPAAPGKNLPFDPLRLVTALIRKWKWLPLAGVALALPVFLFGYFKFKTSYTANVQLIRREVTTTIRQSQLGEAFKPRQVTVGTIVSVMQSPKLLEKAGNAAHPPVTGDALLSDLTIKPQRETDLIAVTLKDNVSALATANLINVYANEVVALTSQMQSEEATELDKFLRDQIARSDAELEQVNKELMEFSRGSEFYGADRQVEAYLHQLGDTEMQLQTAKTDIQTVDFRLGSVERELSKQDPLAMRLNQARQELNTLRSTYADANPIVKDQLEKVATLEKQLAEEAASTNAPAFQFTGNTVANDLYLQLVNLRSQREGLVQRIAQLSDSRTNMQQKLGAMPEKTQRFAQITARQQTLQTTRDLLAGRQREAQVYEANSPGLYRLFAPATEDSVEVGNRWKKIIIATLAMFIFGVAIAFVWICGRELMDLRLVSAGDLRRITGVPVVARMPADLAKFSPTDLAQWRFRAWSQLLRQLKLQNEPRVTLAFTSAKSGEGKSTFIALLRDAAHDRRLAVVSIANAPSSNPEILTAELADALAEPELVLRHLREEPGVPLELRFDAAWVWNLENRARWQRATEAWQAVPSLILLVELPAMAGLDAVLAAELMPALVWVAASGVSQQNDIARMLETVAAGEVTLAAAALNREPKSFSSVALLEKLLPLALAFSLFAAGAARAADGQQLATAGAFSGSSQTPFYAGWQQHFTVGAGDVFNLRIYGRTDSTRSDVPVGPDGRITFMEAQSVPVAGLTVDEMRAKLDTELGKFYRNVRTIVIPIEWRSKRYYLMGSVVDRGAYILDRPLTIIEAVARARGIATGLYEHNTVELADLKRAFLVRASKRMPVDFDQLFNHGDLTQNILVEPGDYIYFPSGTVNEVYLLGAVGTPGPLGLTAGNTLVGLLTVRGGLLPTAYQQRVLVVRGSLQKPQTFAVDVAAILAGRQKNFVLEPKDIIYVAEKPWQRVEELMQTALRAYVQAMTTAWVGNNIKSLTTEPLLPQLQ